MLIERLFHFLTDNSLDSNHFENIPHQIHGSILLKILLNFLKIRTSKLSKINEC